MVLDKYERITWQEVVVWWTVETPHTKKKENRQH